MHSDSITENTASQAVLEAINPLLTSSDDKITQCTRMSGGSICQAFKVETGLGQTFFVKTLGNASENFFIREAEGLHTLSQSNQVKTPPVLVANTAVLIMTYVETSTPNKTFWKRAGEQLANLHKSPQSYFGFEHDNFCGSTPQPNSITDNAFDFFRQSRLLHQVSLTNSQRLLSPADRRKIDQLCYKLVDLIPDEAPSLLHGDLWSGNLICDHDDQPWFIDPATYYSWREIDIAMTTLFGGFGPGFYEAYHYHYPLEPGWKERMEIYNLYPLLNHLNLFGSQYLAPIRSTLNRFV